MFFLFPHLILILAVNVPVLISVDFSVTFISSVDWSHSSSQRVKMALEKHFKMIKVLN